MNQNYQLLLAAPGQLTRWRDGVRCLVVGEGALKPGLIRQAQDLGLAGTVRFLGFRNDVRGILRASDLFVLPSSREGLPVALLEAMAAGLPVVATAVGGVSDVVEDGVSGRLVSPRDAATISDAVRVLIADPAGPGAGRPCPGACGRAVQRRPDGPGLRASVPGDRRPQGQPCLRT